MTARPTARALRWVWALVVVAVVTVVVVREWGRVGERVGDLSWQLLVVAFLATSGAKLCLGENARLAAAGHGIELPRLVAMRLYNVSQLGKYVPGSVWQFVGRAVAYRDRGAGYGAIRDALLTESLWLIGGAGLTGVVLGGTAVLPVVVGGLSRTTMTWLAVGAGVVLVVVVAVVLSRRSAVVRYVRAAAPTPRVLGIQALTWLLLGTGCWAVCRAADVSPPWPYAVGLFAAGYAVGFVVLLAPAGLGVRDGILVAGLLPFTDSATAIVIAVVARLVYLGVEVVLVVVGEGAAALRRRRGVSAHS